MIIDSDKMRIDVFPKSEFHSNRFILDRKIDRTIILIFSHKNSLLFNFLNQIIEAMFELICTCAAPRSSCTISRLT